MKRKAIVIDLDSTVLDTQFILDEIHKLGLKGDEKWEYFYKHCNSDRVEVIEETKKFLDTILKATYEVEVKPRIITIDSVALIASTARSKSCHNKTHKKLMSVGIYPDYIFMREKDDYRLATEVKKDHLLVIMENFDIIAFIDDDLQNCEMAKSLGVLALRRV